MQVHVIGSAVLDALCGPITTYPTPKTHAQVTAERVEFQPGGGAVNTSLALAQLGIDVAIFTRVGADMTGRFLIDTLKTRGVNVDNMLAIQGGQTPFTFVGIHPDGERSFVHTPGVNLQTVINDFPQPVLLACGILLFQDLFVQPAMDGAPAADLFRRARAQGLVTVLDECWGLGPKKELLEPVLPYVDFFLPSFDDLKAIYPAHTAATLPKHLQDLGAKSVVLKMGAQGCLISHAGKTETIPTQAQKIVDTTGAGDCFDAGFIAGLVHGLDPFEAARVAQQTAAACIAHVGGANGIPHFASFVPSVR